MNRHELVKAARLYYVEGVNLTQIASRLRVSPATVSRMLGEARRSGIVEIRINDEHADSSELEIAVERRYSLSECLVVAISDGATARYRRVAGKVAGILSRIVGPGSLVGVSWGQTLKSVAEHLSFDRAPGADAVPILGAMGTVETGIYPNAIAREFAGRLGGKSYLVNVPAIVDSATVRKSIEPETSARHARNKWSKVSTVLLSVSGLGADASVSKYRIIQSDELRTLRKSGVVCATNFTMLDEDGHEVASAFRDRLFGMGLDDLLAVRNRIVIAFGENKVHAMRAALRGGIATILVTDVESAHALADDD